MTFTSCRFFSHVVERTLVKTRTPGLIVYENFLQRESYEILVNESLSLREKIDRVRASAMSYRSQNHNIPGERTYKAVVVKDQFRPLQCEDFLDYGDQNHSLTYFRDNPNIPLFVSSHLIAPISQLPVIAQMGARGVLNWRFTLNTYAPHVEDSGKLAGFGFHKDIAVNGTVTMIYSLGTQALFRIRNPDDHKDCETFPLLANSLLILSGMARWDYEHCVLPAAAFGSSLSSATAIRRISLVLGCKPVPLQGASA